MTSLEKYVTENITFQVLWDKDKAVFRGKFRAFILAFNGGWWWGGKQKTKSIQSKKLGKEKNMIFKEQTQGNMKKNITKRRNQ